MKQHGKEKEEKRKRKRKRSSEKINKQKEIEPI